MIDNRIAEHILSSYEEQFRLWPEARENYARLGETCRRALEIPGGHIYLQHNPARARSTQARTDAASIAARPCFLCSANRPKEQMAAPWPEGFELLVNPYPIFPIHFTIASTAHEPQSHWPLAMLEFASEMPGVCAFYNGARAGASAPDHLHFQAVSADELPLMRRVAQLHRADRPGIEASWALDPQHPVLYYSAVLPKDDAAQFGEIVKAMRTIAGRDAATGEISRELLNVFVWLSPEDGALRIVALPRAAHRPSCYLTESGEGFAVSPGAVDVAGILILPRKEDFDRMTAEDALGVLRDTCLPNTPPE